MPANEPLRGDPFTLRQRSGAGYFGEVYNEEEPDLFATTCVWFQANIPLLVPGLTRREIAHLVAGGAPTDRMKVTAYQHAQMRGYATFATAEDPQHPLPEDTP